MGSRLPTFKSLGNPPPYVGGYGGDGEILAWIEQNSRNKHTDAEIAAWSKLAEGRVPTDPESRAYFNELHEKTAPQRDDIATWFDLLDVDDYVTFGGKP